MAPTVTDGLMSGLRPDIKPLTDLNPWGMEPLVLTVFYLRFLVRINTREIAAILWPDSDQVTIRKGLVRTISYYRWKVLEICTNGEHSELVSALKVAVDWVPSMLESNWDNGRWLPLLEEIGLQLPRKTAGKPRQQRAGAKNSPQVSPTLEVEPMTEEVSNPSKSIELESGTQVTGNVADENTLQQQEVGTEPEAPTESDLEQIGQQEPTEVVRPRYLSAYPYKQVHSIRRKPRQPTDPNGQNEYIPRFQGTPSPPPAKRNACPRCDTSELVLERDIDGHVWSCISCGYKKTPQSYELLPLEDMEDSKKQRRRSPSHGKIRL